MDNGVFFYCFFWLYGKLREDKMRFDVNGIFYDILSLFHNAGFTMLIIFDVFVYF